MTDRDGKTDPSELAPESERTPLESPYSLKQVMLALGKIEIHAAAAANNSLHTASRVDRLAEAFESLVQRVTALEITQRRAPLILSSLAFALALWAMFQVHR